MSRFKNQGKAGVVESAGSITVGFCDGPTESTKPAVLRTLEWHNGWISPTGIPNPQWHFLTTGFIGNPMAVKQGAQMVFN